MRDGNEEIAAERRASILVVSLPMRDGNVKYQIYHLRQVELLAYL